MLWLVVTPARLASYGISESMISPYSYRDRDGGQIGPAPVLFRSFESDTRHEGDRIWQQYTAMSSSVCMRNTRISRASIRTPAPSAHGPATARNPAAGEPPSRRRRADLRPPGNTPKRLIIAMLNYPFTERIAGRLTCGNTLSGEAFAHAFTPAAASFVVLHGQPAVWNLVSGRVQIVTHHGTRLLTHPS